MTVLSLESKTANAVGFKGWRVELLFAAPIVALVIYLFYTWFAVLNRYLIFLYFHGMGSGFDTSPFGWVTASRYWMSGLVAGGAVMVAYAALNLVLGRVIRRYRAPVWWRVWLLCAAPLLIAIPAIVMTVNDPILPLYNAAQVTAVTLIGLALAVMLGQMAASRPLAYLLLMADGCGLALLLGALISFENYPRWLARGNTGYIIAHLALIAIGILLVILVSAFRCWRRTAIPEAGTWFVSALNIAYLFLPLCHHLFFSTDGGSWTDPGYFVYISDANNYFARSGLLQVAIWTAVALIAWGVTRLRRWLSARRMTGRPAGSRVHSSHDPS